MSPLLAAVSALAALVPAGWCQVRNSVGPACPDKNGRYPSPSQCDAYVECVEGVAREVLCPDGLLFNPRAQFTYPCQYPVDVDCEGRSGLQPAQPTDQCPHQFGYFLLGDAANCGKFLNCVDGRGYEFDCPLGLAFSQEALRCDWPDQVSSCDAEAFLGFTCPAPQGVFGDEFQYFRSPHDCQRYYICVNGRPRLYACPEGRAFNEDIGGCDGIENVTACYNAGRDQQFQPTQTPVQFQQRRRVQAGFSG
ncbi:protein obstructor-E [Bacillus rossius redtenbacheri]|uniref:protein obstructor-E n=1 Tax=Bacillus rossius redtenbacheri TaxID=93214 RepID=UPI002FDDB29E